MVQTMSKGLYSMGTVVQGEKLGQFLENEFPSMDDLKVGYTFVGAGATHRSMFFTYAELQDGVSQPQPWSTLGWWPLLSGRETE